MTDLDPAVKELRRELEQYQKEQDKIRRVVGQIGGAKSAKRDKAITVGFMAALLVLFVLDMCRHILHLPLPLPPLFSIELGVLMVSIKIIWMIHKQGKVEHFQFWILNAIEFRLNDIGKRMKQLEKHMERSAREDGGA